MAITPAVVTEDRFSKEWPLRALKTHKPEHIERLEVLGPDCLFQPIMPH